MSVQIQEQEQRHQAVPSANGATSTVEDAVSRPVDDGIERPAGFSLPAAPAPAVRRRPAFLTRRVLLPVAAIVVIAVALFAFNGYREGQLYVSTENAQLTGQPVQVGAMNAGRVESITPSIGSAVRKGDVVAQVALPSQMGMGQNGQPKMGFLGAGDTRVDVQAPFDGIVIAEPVAIGATVAAGQPIVSIVDPTQLWVNANIEETNIGRVRGGQPVLVHVDAQPVQHFAATLDRPVAVVHRPGGTPGQFQAIPDQGGPAGVARPGPPVGQVGGEQVGVDVDAHWREPGSSVRRPRQEVDVVAVDLVGLLELRPVGGVVDEVDLGVGQLGDGAAHDVEALAGVLVGPDDHRRALHLAEALLVDVVDVAVDAPVHLQHSAHDP